MTENNDLTKICRILNIPSLPNKEWDGKTSFRDGVAVIKLIDNTETYAISSFDSEKDEKPRIKKVITSVTFTEVLKHYPVPVYMNTNVDDFDLSEEDKEKAQNLIDEAKEQEMSNKEVPSENGNEYFFDEIHNDDEARAFIKEYNTKNDIKGRIPSSHETIIMRLNSIYNEKKK